MSQFNSLRGRGNYANAGRAAANSALRTFIAARRSSPDYGQLAQKGAQLRSEEKKQMIKIKGELASRAIQIKSKLKADQIEMDAERAAKKDKRKAGLLAAAGQLGGMGMMNYGKERLKDRDSSKIIDRYNERIHDLETKAGELRDGTTTISTNTEPGKVDGPVSSAEAMQVTGYTPPKGQKIFSVPEMQNLLINAGLPKDKARTLAAVGMGESGGNAGIDTVISGLDPNKSNEYSIGLFQINTKAHMDKLAKRGYTIEDLRDPQKNAEIAVDVYNEVGSFKPWSVYNSGKHLEFLKP